MTKFTDEELKLICQKFNLEFLRRDVASTKSHVFVKCFCGKAFRTRIDKIKSGWTKSCSCLQRKDLTGQRFGRLMVLGLAEQKGRLGRWWLCKCDCGNEHEVQTNPLMRGATQSCGCWHYFNGPLNKRWKGCGEITGSRWRQTIECAERRGIAFEITIGEAWDIWETQKGLCAISGIPIQLRKMGGKYNSRGDASLDRKDSTLGYTRENCQWVHKTVNRIKWHLPFEEFMYWIKTIYREQVDNALCDFRE